MVRRGGRKRISKTPKKEDRLSTVQNLKTPDKKDGAATLPDLEVPEKEDRLSNLPDCLIQHIFSLFPSTKQAIRTCVLSKQWQNQWTFVSDLIFDFSGMCSDYSPENVSLTTATISRIIDRTFSLHEFPKIQKFHITFDRFYDCEQDPDFEENVRFVVRKQAKEITLKFSVLSEFRLPEFFFVQSSLVKLQLFGCSIKPAAMTNWKSLKDLCIDNCTCTCDGFENIVCCSPSLQSLEVKYCIFQWLNRVVIASKSLKKLVVFSIGCYVDISCPNLVEFYCGHKQGHSFGDKLLEKFVSESPLLESLELEYLEFSDLRIASCSLKKLVICVEVSNKIDIACPYLRIASISLIKLPREMSNKIEIASPNLKELYLTGCIGTMRLTTLPSSVCAYLNFKFDKFREETLAKKMLEQVQHLNVLKLGRFFIEFLSYLEKDGISHALLNCKYLTLYPEFGPSYLHIPGIVYALRSTPVLERLVVKVQPHKYRDRYDDSKLYHPEDDYWSLKETHFSCSMSQLKTVMITGFSQIEYRRKAVLDFVGFLLKHASALEKIVIVTDDCGTDYVTEAYWKLLSFPRCSDPIIKFV